MANTGTALALANPSREEMILSLRDCVAINAKLFLRAGVPADLEDLQSAGWKGAIEAVDRYSASHQVKLSTFARHRIRGEIRDYLRELDPLSRNHRARIKNAGAEEPSTCSIEAVAGVLGQSDPVLERILAGWDCRPSLFSCLDRRERRVIRMRYFDDMFFKQIAKIIGVNESRAWQIHNQAIGKMRASARA